MTKELVELVTVKAPSKSHYVKCGTHEDELPSIKKDRIISVWYRPSKQRRDWLGNLHLDKNGVIVEFSPNDHLCLDLGDIMYISRVVTAWNNRA